MDNPVGRDRLRAVCPQVGPVAWEGGRGLSWVWWWDWDWVSWLVRVVRRHVPYTTGAMTIPMDHRELFDFSVESFKTFSREGSKFILEEVNYDLHGKSKALDDTSDIITTEYEKKFLSKEASIHFLRARLSK